MAFKSLKRFWRYITFKPKDTGPPYKYGYGPIKISGPKANAWIAADLEAVAIAENYVGSSITQAWYKLDEDKYWFAFENNAELDCTKGFLKQVEGRKISGGY